MHTSDKRITRQRFLELVPPGTCLMIGGFLAVGTPESFIDWLVEAECGELTLIANDTGFPDKGIGRLIAKSLVKEGIVTHCGTNPLAGEQYNQGTLKLELCPQGTLIERIHAGGAGLGGVLSKTGLGTVVEQAAEKIVLDDQEYLYHTPLRASVALIKAWRGDEQGNLRYRRTARNFNPELAFAADIVIAEVEELVPLGSLDPDEVMTPGILVDYIYSPPKVPTAEEERI